MKNSTWVTVGAVAIGGFALLSVLPQVSDAVKNAIGEGTGNLANTVGQAVSKAIGNGLAGLTQPIADAFKGSGSVQLPDGSWSYSGKDAEDRTYDPAYYQQPLYSPAQYAPIVTAIDQWFQNNQDTGSTAPIDYSKGQYPSDWQTIDSGGY